MLVFMFFRFAAGGYGEESRAGTRRNTRKFASQKEATRQLLA
jgi:hypothetical protein